MSQTSKAAMRPDVFVSFQQIEKEERDKGDKKEEGEEDLALASLSNHAGWRHLSEYIERLKKDMDAFVAELISEGGNFEDIGRITVVTNLTKEKLNAIQQKVQDAKEEVEGK